ncbi:MFS transporter [Streptomyces tendae]|uniref:MFS transporter n=1 Tax=Streptomyces tendae TaxID=1932 RepID=UPI0013306435|nr:MFS transporter [Streptomyces tendae]
MPKGYSLRFYLAAATAARAGDEMSGPALLLAGLAVTGSTTDASALLAGITVSAAVGGPLLGALLDRARRPGRLLAGALALYAAGLMTILAGLGRLPMAWTLPLAVLTGLLGPALSGGWTAQLPRVAADVRLPRANALDAMTFGVASLAGPALAGGVAVLLGAPSAVAVSAALITAAVPAAWRLPARGAPDRDARPAPVAGALAAGFRIVLRRPLLARATFTSVASCAAQGMLAACVPLLGAQWLGAAGRGVLLFSGAAVSALAANAVLARRPLAVAPDTVVRAGALVQAVALALAATGLPVALVVAVLLLGIGEGPQLTALFAVRHREAPEHLRGQVFTTGASLKITAFALGVAVAGPLAGWSLPATLTLAAGTAAGGALALGRESV